MSYRIEYLPEALDDLRAVPAHYRSRLRRLIEGLADQPRPPRSKELRGAPGRWRLRLDEWRVIYQVDDQYQAITVLAVRHKTGPETYRELPDPG